MKLKTSIPFTAILLAASHASGVVAVIDSITVSGGGTIDVNTPNTNSVNPETLVADGQSYTINSSAVSTNTGTSGAGSGNLFFAPDDASAPTNFSDALTDGDIMSGQFNSQNSVLNFTSITITDSFAVFFRGAVAGFNATFDQLPESVILVDAGGTAITDNLSLPALASDPPIRLVNASFARGNGTTAGSAVGGYIFEATDFTFTGGNSIGDAVGVQFPLAANSDVTEVFQITPVPEPGSTALLALAGTCLLLRKKR